MKNMLKRLLTQSPIASMVIATTAATLLSSWLIAASGGGMSVLAHFAGAESIPRILGAIAVIAAGVCITYAMLRLAQVASNVGQSAAGPVIAPEHLRLLKIVDPGPALPQGRSAQQALDDLDAMVGLMPVKTEVNTLIARLQLEARRRSEGMKVMAVSQHMIFTGPPGVGKTEVARAIGDIFRGLGVLKKGHLVETQRSDFIGQFIGHTAKKTLELCDRALDGILFIDEAYSLVVDGAANDFGREAIDALLKYMEDHRDRLIVIVAGYSGKMQAFIASNDGLASRFSKTIEFPAYSSQDLSEILLRMAQSQGFRLPADFRGKVGSFVEVHKSSPKWGNARSIRNLLDKLREAQAVRLARDPSARDLDELTMSDLDAALRSAEGSL
jgi:stage V sporulation protein K